MLQIPLHKFLGISAKPIDHNTEFYQGAKEFERRIDQHICETEGKENEGNEQTIEDVRTIS